MSLKGVKMIGGCNTNDFYKRFFDISPIAFYTTDLKDGTFLRANPACIDMLGYSSFEEMKDNIKSTDLYPKDVRDSLIQKIKDIGKIDYFEAIFTLPKGDKINVVISAAVCPNGDCVFGSIMDLTEKIAMRKKIEEYQRKEIEQIKAIKEKLNEKIVQYSKFPDSSSLNEESSHNSQSSSGDIFCISPLLQAIHRHSSG